MALGKRQEPTCTSLVEEVLVKADDFKTVRQLVVDTCCTIGQVRAALSHLLQHRAVGFISDHSGTWWYSTPQTDNRACTLQYRALEASPRKPRKPRTKKEAPNG